MKRKIVLTSIILILLTLISSCGLSPMEEGRSVNEYIFPYVNFSLSEDESYYSASILSDAAVKSVYIPSYVDDFDGSIPVKYFNGFDNDDDIKALESVTIESPITVIGKSVLDKATNLKRITFTNILNNENDVWTNLPQLEHTEEGEFHGWLLVVNDGNVGEGGGMSMGYTSIYPNWGTHTFGETHAGQEPTCTEPGWTSYHECLNYLSKDTICPYTSKVDLPALGHSLVKHEKSDADCRTWTIGYSMDAWECTRCGLFFSDADGITQIEKDSVIINPSHTQGGEICSDESSHWYECTICGAKFFGDKNEPQNHDFKNWIDSEDGQSSISYCEICSYETIEAKKHEDADWDFVARQDPTCTESGHEEYYACNKHEGHCFTRSKENVVIKRSIEDLGVYIAPLGHDFSGAYVSSTVSGYHSKLCLRCGVESEERKEHEFEYIFTKNAERYFTVKRKCIVCGATGEDSSKHRSAFDISASFGNIKILRGSGNTWTLSYTGKCADCYWTDEEGEKLIDDVDPFTISYTSGGGGEFKVFCYALNSKGEISEIAFALLTAN